MNKSTIRWLFFCAVCIAQLYVPAKMISDKASTIRDGQAYRFRTIPVDPSDPFRGKYIALRFEQMTFPVFNEQWTNGDEVYVLLETDASGFAVQRSIQRERPRTYTDYFKTTIDFVSNGEVTVRFPVDRLYLEESKAAKAEEIYRSAQRDQTVETYALVFIKKGEVVLQDVFIDEVSIKELVME